MAPLWEALYDRLKAKTAASQHVKFFDVRYLNRESGNQELAGIVNIVMANFAAYRAFVYSKAVERELRAHAGWDFATWCRKNESTITDIAPFKTLQIRDSAQSSIPWELIESPLEFSITTIDFKRAAEIMDFIESDQFDKLLTDLYFIQIDADASKKPANP